MDGAQPQRTYMFMCGRARHGGGGGGCIGAPQGAPKPRSTQEHRPLLAQHHAPGTSCTRPCSSAGTGCRACLCRGPMLGRPSCCPCSLMMLRRCLWARARLKAAAKGSPSHPLSTAVALLVPPGSPAGRSVVVDFLACGASQVSGRGYLLLERRGPRSTRRRWCRGSCSGPGTQRWGYVPQLFVCCGLLPS